MATVLEPRYRPQQPMRTRIILNFPPELARRVRALAKQERRPLTTQIQLLVERALQEQAA